METKIVTLCGSSRFVDIMAVYAWLIEKNENGIAMGLHLLPVWYPDCPPDHLAEHESVADQMDALHLRKVDISDEIFVVNFEDYIGSSTSKEIAHAIKTGKPVRYFMSDDVGSDVLHMMLHAAKSPNTPQPEGKADEQWNGSLWRGGYQAQCSGHGLLGDLSCFRRLDPFSRKMGRGLSCFF